MSAENLNPKSPSGAAASSTSVDRPLQNSGNSLITNSRPLGLSQADLQFKTQGSVHRDLNAAALALGTVPLNANGQFENVRASAVGGDSNRGVGISEPDISKIKSPVGGKQSLNGDPTSTLLGPGLDTRPLSTQPFYPKVSDDLVTAVSEKLTKLTPNELLDQLSSIAPNVTACRAAWNDKEMNADSILHYFDPKSLS